MSSEEDGMETTKKQIKALEMYYEIAKKEYDDTHAYYSGVDNKASIFIAINIAVPSILLSVIEIPPGVYGKIAFGLYALGIIMFICVLYRIFQALRIQTAKFGVPFDDFQEDCKRYDNEAMKEAIANTWLKAAKVNHTKANKKADQLRRLQWPLLFEVGFLFAGAIVALAHGL
jgi:hypothetical protein